MVRVRRGAGLSWCGPGGFAARRCGVPLRPPVPPQRHDCPQLGAVRLPPARRRNCARRRGRTACAALRRAARQAGRGSGTLSRAVLSMRTGWTAGADRCMSRPPSPRPCVHLDRACIEHPYSRQRSVTAR
ncbi:hypothetical protein EZV63_19100 [Streptomyces sp. VN1]|nr:hypothetical protein EZV63_19100 [Streptomyces sp. VN1]